MKIINQYQLVSFRIIKQLLKVIKVYSSVYDNLIIQTVFTNISSENNLSVILII